MNGFLKPYLFRAILFSGLALILGLSLSYIVYNSSTKIEKNTFELVNNYIPILNSSNQIIEILIAQERNIYEYFVTQDDSLFISKQKELEGKELEAWQNLAVALRHEIVNSITPIASMTSTLNEIIEEEIYVSLHKPHSSLKPNHQDLIWSLLVNIVPKDMLFLYWYDKEQFYELYASLDESTQEWVIETICNNF